MVLLNVLGVVDIDSGAKAVFTGIFYRRCSAIRIIGSELRSGSLRSAGALIDGRRLQPLDPAGFSVRIVLIVSVPIY